MMSYDLIDKLRFWEKAVLERPDDEVAKHVAGMAAFLDKLRVAYLAFSDQEL
jgi:hypothetical protein